MKLREHLRITGLIARKDILDSLKNRTLLALLASVALMMLSSQILGWVSGLRGKTVFYVYDEGRSAVLNNVFKESEFMIVRARSLDDLFEKLGGAPGPAAGIIFPENFDRLAESLAPIGVIAVGTSRDTREEAAVLIALFEQDFFEVSGVTVKASLVEEKAFPRSDTSDYSMMLAIGLVMGVMIVGLILTPYLVIDEKTTHTLETLLVSPARHIHLVGGKLLAGTVYSLSASVLIAGASRAWVAHWQIMLPAIFLGAACSSAIGLLIGMLFDHPTNVNMAGGLLIAVMLLPVVFWEQLSGIIRGNLAVLLSWMPSVRMYMAVRKAFTEAPAAGSVTWDLAAMAAACLLVLAWLAFSIRRLDR